MAHAAPEDAPAPQSATQDALPSSEIDWVPIHGGTFIRHEGERNQKIFLENFEISRSEVTVEQFRRCVQQGRCSEPVIAPRCNYGYYSRAKHPINCVTWEQASEFAAFVGGRLPTEAEWEFAARSGGQDKLFPWGNFAPSCERTWFGTCAPYETAEVCIHPGGNTEQGLCDMAGNVYEWTGDWYAHYTNERDLLSPAGANDGDYRVIRGGGFNATPAELKTDHRNAARGQLPYIGFRVVRVSTTAKSDESAPKPEQ